MLEATDIAHRYNGAAGSPVLDGLQIRLEAGELCVVVGPSGSGKSTLLFVLAGLLKPTAGLVRIRSDDVYAAPGAWRRGLLRSRVRLSLQQFRLTPYLTAAQNVRLGGAGRPGELLREVGLAGCDNKTPARLSAGEQQRVTLAQALACEPELLLADEPTSSLDAHNKSRVYGLLRDRCQAGMTALVAAHDSAAVEHADRVLHLHDGRLHADG